TYHVVPYEGISELLREMKARGIHLAVLTNKPHKQAVHVVEEVFGEQMFDWIQGQQEGIPRKPDPFAAVHIAKSLGIKPENSLYIGDSEVDIATGLAAGMRTYGVTWGFRSRQQLVDSGALYIVDKPIQILEEIVQGGD
ncbi:MAG: HAD family hydrolase, partial [Hespellia sp.]|nr:HAD family hydrolase [Hespellia sp.]